MMPAIWMKLFQVRIRRGPGWEVRPEAEAIDGKVFMFRWCGTMTAEERLAYAGETMWMPVDDSYPADAPGWICEGDLTEPPAPSPR